MPAFNIKGRDKVKTAVGGILSATIMSVTLGYAIMKIYECILRTDPVIS